MHKEEAIMGKTLHNTIRLGRRTIIDIVVDEAQALLRKLRHAVGR